MRMAVVRDSGQDSSLFAQVNRGRIMTASERTPAVMEWIVGQIDLAMDPPHWFA